ncbi:MAG: site-specific integrase [Bifidobacteriaceae bacterium]|jgi:site-specific recombinase XerD|nr:site-specific integrase [Bifidobacteriaceae bacterium]
MRVPGPPSAVLCEYETWLADERGLVASTIGNHLRWARRWLEWLEADGGSLGQASAGQVGRFVAQTAAGCASVGTAKTMVVSLRVFLRCAFARGWTGADLRGAVPRVACWRGAQIAKALPAGVVDRLVGCHDLGTAQGLRDRAVVLLLARLGLRRIEVARLVLADVDWRAGAVTVTGKGGARDRLPLPGEVAEALAAYVMGGRPGGLGDAVFFTVWPPVKPITPQVVSSLVRAAAQRCGLEGVGPHRLRHTLASQMLRAGAGLEAVGQVLRHKDLSSTSVYAKIDLARLGRLAPLWPEAADDRGADR